ncbi:MAG: NAD-dependent epimerase/dehydratase family protein [Planctomycetota bacterium]
MQIAVTGGSGFLGRYLIDRLLNDETNQVRAWSRHPHQQKQHARLEWIEGQLGDEQATTGLVKGCDAVVHCALSRSGGFMDHPEDPVGYFQINGTGSLALIETARVHGVERFVFVSSGAVHQHVLPNHALDETHPQHPMSMYGVAKASVESMIHAYGLTGKLNCCTVRPPSIYGTASPVEQSKWFHLIQQIKSGQDVEATGGSKTVHADDVCTAIQLLLTTDEEVAGETFNCCDRMISDWEVAHIAKRILDSASRINGQAKQAKHAIVTDKIESLGLSFGGTPKLEATITEIAAQPSSTLRLRGS